MAQKRRSSNGNILNIELESPPNYVYTNGEIVSGRVTLRSSSDEDVYSIVLQLSGSGESYVGMAGRNNNQVGLPDQWSGQVFLDMHQQLYEGTYTLRKDVMYEWPFKMRFPDSKALIPSGSHGKNQMMSNGDTGITYELKASRATSAEQAKALLEKAVKGQGAGIKSKVRGMTASTITVDLNFLPSRPNYIPSELTPTREVWNLPVHAHGEAGHSKFTFKSLFKPPPSNPYTVRVDLPKNFVQFERLPAFIRVVPKSYENGQPPSNPGPIIVEKVEFILSMRVRHKASGYVGENLESMTILKLENPGIVITDTGRYDIGGPYKTHKPMWPTFNSDVVETRHNLRAHVTLNASGKKFEDIFVMMNCNVYPKRVTPTPLNQDYTCNFFSQSSASPTIDEMGKEVIAMPHKDVIDAFFTVSRLLTEKKIYPQFAEPHDPSAVLALHLPGQANQQLKPHAPTPESSLLPGSRSLPNPRAEDQKCLSSILEVGTGIKATTSHISDQGSFAYRYGGEKSPSQVRLEFSDAAIATTSLPPPSYSSSGLSSQPPPRTHAALTPATVLSALLHSLATSDPTSTQLHDSNNATLANVAHLCQEYSSQLAPSSSSSTIDPASAAQAVLKFPQLRKPLVELAGMDAATFGAEEDDEPKPKLLTKEEAKFERRKELANKVGYWSATAQKREQVYSSN